MPDSSAIETTYVILLSVAGTIILLLIAALTYFIRGKLKKSDKNNDDLIEMKLETNEELSEIKLLVQKTHITMENFTESCHLRHSGIADKFQQHDAVLADHGSRISKLEKNK